MTSNRDYRRQKVIVILTVIINIRIQFISHFYYLKEKFTCYKTKTVRPRPRPRLALVWDRSCHKTTVSDHNANRANSCDVFSIIWHLDTSAHSAESHICNFEDIIIGRTSKSLNVRKFAATDTNGGRRYPRKWRNPVSAADLIIDGDWSGCNLYMKCGRDEQRRRDGGGYRYLYPQNQPK